MSSNIPESIRKKIGLNLHNKKGHPIKIIKEHIYKYFDKLGFKMFDNLSPHVSTVDNFDLLRIDKDHVSRSRSDTYYIDDKTVLRTHTSAHQNELLAKGLTSFLVVGDVYRKDEIDRSHYPVFHQMEGVHLVEDDVDPKEDLIKVLGGLIKYLFDIECMFKDDYFPFTAPSFEAEILFNGKLLEILGCGVIHHEILNRHGIKKKGWAFGLGLERLAMILFKIPDIRLFWTNDVQFTKQFADEKIVEFKPYPVLDVITKDISFWIPNKEIQNCEDGTNYKWLKINDFYEVVREVCGDFVERVELRDQFYHSKHQKYSVMVRLYFSPTVEMTDPSELSELANGSMKSVGERLMTVGYVVR